MPQTFYIENDEEIISVIGRLRKSTFEENYFVFPKRALVLQSIVNLRLFQREAEKLGKTIVIVTQDDAGKVMAEKAGLATERYTDDFSRQAEHIELQSVLPPQKHQPSPNPSPVVDHTGLRSKDIGSSDFYSAPVTALPAQPTQTTPVTGRTLRIRNASPEKQTSLNSQRLAPQVTPRPIERMTAPTVYPQAGIAAVRRAPLQETSRVSQPQSDPRQVVQSGREERLRNFFSSGGTNVVPTSSAPKKELPVPKVAVASRKAGGIFLLLGGISALSLIGVAIFLFLPKAEVHIIPYRTVDTVDLQFEGKETTTLEDERVLPVRLVEKEQEISLTIEATGTSLGGAQKARGTVMLVNTFGSDAQSLVATTRLESPDGKIFRLLEGVTVPGMSGSQPGSIEASVIADQVGTEYNIAPTNFTIPGFKGGPKYDKFSAKSTKAMAGGSANSGANQTIISKTDLEKASLQAREQARQMYLDGVSKDLHPGERILEENIDIVSLKDASLPLSGTTASSFEYKNTFKIRSFVFSEETLKERILSAGEEEMSGILFRPISVVLSYGEAIPDFDARTVRLKTHAIVTSESVIDREKFLADILGKDETGIDTALRTFPEIKKIEVVFKPQWFTSSVPDSENRVSLIIEPGEE